MINIDIQDTCEEATIRTFLMCENMQTLSSSSDLDDDNDEVLQEFQAKCDRRILQTVFIYYLKLEAGAILINFRCLISLRHSRIPIVKAGQV